MQGAIWIKNFTSCLAPTASPEPYLHWAAISTVAGAMARNVWVETLGSKLYPNLYTVLVGPPGVGKTEITNRVWDIWKSLPQRFTAASNVSRAGLVDQLNESSIEGSNCLLVCSNELGVLLPQYDTEFMAALTDLYDCRAYYERKRGGVKINIDNPQLNLLAGCTPDFLQRVFPESAWQEGFCSRTIFIYYGGLERRSLFGLRSLANMEKLKNTLETLSSIKGQFKFSKEAEDYLDDWHLGGNKPVPNHPKLMHYCTRRTAHAIKLSMVSAISPSLTIKLKDVQTAVSWLVNAETSMEEIFKSMASGGDGNVMRETLHFIYTYERTKGSLVSKRSVLAFLGERVDVWKVNQMITLLEDIEAIELVGNNYKYIGKNTNF